MHQFEDFIGELITIRDVIRFGVSQFTKAELYYGHGTDNPWDEAEHLVAHALHLTPPIADQWLDARLTQAEKQAVSDYFGCRINDRTPVAYIIGQAWFVGLPFDVDERVLIPRSPIGELIDKQFSPWIISPPERILDLCTGSGCIGIACAYAFPNSEVQLSDISFEALEVAEHNIQKHQLGERVYAIQSDLFEGLQGQTFDLIVANPPYVDAQDMADLPAEYHTEPELALASGVDGLDFTRRLLREALDYLSPTGVLVVEVGNSWVALAEAYPQLPLTWVEFERGGHGVFVLNAQDLERARQDGLL